VKADPEKSTQSSTDDGKSSGNPAVGGTIVIKKNKFLIR
jgi:hypothetical protein